MLHVCCVYLFKVKVARVLKMATTIEIQIQKEFALGRLGALFKGGLNILWILTLKYGFGPGYWDFQEMGPWYFVLFFLKTAVDQYFAFIKGWRFFSVSYLLNFVTQYYVKEQIENQCFKLSRCLALLLSLIDS